MERIIIIGERPNRIEKIRNMFGPGNYFSVPEKPLAEIIADETGPLIIVKSDSKTSVKPRTIQRMISKVMEKEFDLFYFYRGSDLEPQAVLFSEEGLSKTKNLLRNNSNVSEIFTDAIAKKKLDIIFAKPNIIEVMTPEDHQEEIREELRKEVKKELKKEAETEKLYSELESVLQEEQGGEEKKEKEEKRGGETEERKETVRPKILEYKSIQIDDYEIDQTLTEKIKIGFGNTEVLYIVLILLLIAGIYVVFRK